MADFTIEELQALLALRKPDTEDFHENGAYDAQEYQYQLGMYQNRQAYGKQLLDTMQALEAQQAENRALSAKIAAAENVMRTAQNLLLQIGSSIESEGEIGLGVAAEQSVRVADEIRKVLDAR